MPHINQRTRSRAWIWYMFSSLGTRLPYKTWKSRSKAYFCKLFDDLVPKMPHFTLSSSRKGEFWYCVANNGQDYHTVSQEGVKIDFALAWSNSSRQQNHKPKPILGRKNCATLGATPRPIKNTQSDIGPRTRLIRKTGPEQSGILADGPEIRACLMKREACNRE